MATENDTTNNKTNSSGWITLHSEAPPKPGVWPAMMALGITFLVWGLVTSLIITGIGLVLFVSALAGWIRDIRHERAKH